eukprot:c17435_g2_i1 orf=23-352(+)
MLCTGGHWRKMAAIVWQAENRTLSLSQQDMCAKEDVIPRNLDDVCIETEISLHELQSEPLPSFMLQQTDQCIGEEYALFQTGIARPRLSFDTKPQSEHTMRPCCILVTL